MTYRFFEKYPELGKDAVPVEACISQEALERERDLIFRKVWLNVGRVEKIPNVGDYFVKDIQICNVSALIVRQKDGKVGAFHNVCSHRCNKLVWDYAGNTKAFRCKFHSWVYNTEGKLTAVPDKASFYDLKMDALGLTPITVDVWRGFIFVNLDPNCSQSLAEYLGEFGKQIEAFPFEDLTTYYAYATEFKANWKITLDAFQEGYHVFSLHKNSIPGFGSGDNPWCQPLDIFLYTPHRLYSQQASTEYTVTPTAEIMAKYAKTFTSQMHGAVTDYPGVNPTKSPKWAMDVCVFFPNFSCNLTNGMVFTYNFWPLAVDRTYWEFGIYYPATKTVGELISREFSKVLFRDAILEDISTVEQTQSVLASRAKTHFVLQDNEVMVRHAYKVIEDYIGLGSGNKA